MTSCPKVSVLIPTYNYARYLPEAIDSVLAQEFTDFELIISDDCSKDESADLLRRHAARDPRIRLHLQPANLGLVPNWNWCLQQARGDYVKYVFGDDALPSRQALGSLAALLDAASSAVLAASARLILDPDSRPAGVWDEMRTAGLHRGADVIARCLREDRNLIGEPSAVMFRREAAARGFDPQWRQLVDLEMWLHLLSSGDLAHVPEPLCAFRLHAAQQSTVNRHANVGPGERARLVARYADRLGPGSDRQLLFRCIYYSRKYAPRTPENAAAEAALATRLPRVWYLLLWLRHRITKPLLNLGRLVRRRHHSGPPS